MKIFCIGKNYADHAAEMNSAVPEAPLVFMKPSTALLKDDEPFYYPEFTKDLHHEIELVIKFGKNGKHIQPNFALSYIESFGIGLDLTARDLQKECKDKGYPWEIAKAFDHSAIVSTFLPFDYTRFLASEFSLELNGQKKQFGSPKDLIFDLPTLISYVSRYFTIQKGDLLFTGTPSGVGSIRIGDRLEGYLNGEKILYCDIK